MEKFLPALSSMPSGSEAWIPSVIRCGQKPTVMRRRPILSSDSRANSSASATGVMEQHLGSLPDRFDETRAGVTQSTSTLASFSYHQRVIGGNGGKVSFEQHNIHPPSQTHT